MRYTDLPPDQDMTAFEVITDAPPTQSDTHGYSVSLRSVLNVVSCFTVLLVVLVTVIVVGHARAPHIDTTLLDVATQTPVPPVSPPGVGWSAAGPSFAQTIAFAPSAPATAYACGNSATSAGSNPAISLVASTDGMATWGDAQMVGNGNQCTLSIDPLDASDVVMSVGSCFGCVVPLTSTTLYRSRDSGVHWLALAPPTEQGQVFFVQKLAWAGSSLFVVPFVTPPITSLHAIAASVAGGPLRWADGGGFALALSPRIVINSIVGLGDTLFASYLDETCQAYCEVTAITRDGGATWQQQRMTVRGSDVIILSAQSATHALLGYTFLVDSEIYEFVRSTDGGAHWDILPHVPVNPATDGGAIFEAPTGAISIFLFAPANRVYVLPVKQKQWLFVAPLPGGVPLTLAFDARGNVTALWARAQRDVALSPQPGLQTHTP